MTAWARKSTKMGNVKQSLDGYSFASKLEAAGYQMLKLRMKAGEIDSIQVQDHVELCAGIKYVADFKCTTPSGECFWVEMKGFETPVWKLKLKLWEEFGPGKLEIWRGDYRRPFLDEIVIPK